VLRSVSKVLRYALLSAAQGLRHLILSPPYLRMQWHITDLIRFLNVQLPLLELICFT
jgi:hypothetical protein